MLKALLSSMNSFAWTGSLVPYYETCKKSLESLYNDPDYLFIRDWTSELIDNYSEVIKLEKKRDEEAKLLYE